MRRILLVTVLLVVNLFAQIPIPETGCYHSAFTGTEGLATFETLAGKEIAIEMIFRGWPTNKIPDFPLNVVNTMDLNGIVPHITWMFQVSGSPYPLDGIINGNYDSFITGYALQVKNWGKPLFIRLGHEFNGDWYTYGGANNGGGTLNGFGDPTKADGPERFIAAYKHVHDLFEAQNVDNVAWVWCLNNGSSPNEPWNVPEAYYPGDEYVDWIGFDGYNFGTTQTWSGWSSFFNIYNPMYQKFKTYNKPIMIGEFASVEQGGNKAQWITDAYSTWLKLVYTQIKVVTWFHIAKTEGTVYTDWRINSSSTSLTAYQNAIADPYFLTSVPATNVNDIKTLPDNFVLEQNYPNPFYSKGGSGSGGNPGTSIQYAISNTQFVTLRVYDILGNEIATLVNEEKHPGKYVVEFNTQTGDRKLASGTYFYQLRAGDFIQTKKMLLLQ